MPDAPIWIRTPAALDALTRELSGADAIALDTEADSLHHYPERLCLIQLADPAGRVFFVDPLALESLESLHPLVANAKTIKVLHSAENDLVHLKRRLGFAVASVFDTMLAGRLLGLRELGLDVLLERYLGVGPEKSQQKTNWARRPITSAQEAYAADDVRHLIALKLRLTAELSAAGREAWLVEECEALAASPTPERASGEDGYRRLAAASRLDPRERAVLRTLVAQREAWAVAERRPPFKVLSPDTLVALARLRPGSRDALVGVPGLPPRLVERYGDGLLAAVAHGLAGPLDPPTPPAQRRPPPAPPVVRQRVEALRKWRAAAAEETGLDPGVLLPQRLIDALAAAPPAHLAALVEFPGLRRWRAKAFGAGILAALGGV